MLYNMLSECCVEYKLIQLYRKSSVWCFAFSHTSTFELISSVATALPGVVVTVPIGFQNTKIKIQALVIISLTAR